jgi:hypothetical protein
MKERNCFQDLGIDFEYSRPSVFSEVMFLKNPVNDEITVCKLVRKMMLGEPKVQET